MCVRKSHGLHREALSSLDVGRAGDSAQGPGRSAAVRARFPPRVGQVAAEAPTLPPTREGAVTAARAGPGSAPHTSRPQPRGLVRALTTPQRLALRDASQRARP